MKAGTKNTCMECGDRYTVKKWGSAKYCSEFCAATVKRRTQMLHKRKIRAQK